MPTIDVNGITIEYEREGSGEPLLLIMGLGAQLTAWPVGFVSELVGRGFEVIRFDNRDAGLSSESDWEPPSPVKSFLLKLFRRPVDTGYYIEDLADDAAAVLESLGIESAHVVGASMGGMIAQALAIRHEQRVRSLTSIMSNPGDGSGGATAKVLLQKLRMPTLVVHGLADPLVKPSGGIATAKAVPDSRLLMFPDMGHDLPAPRLAEIAEAITVNAQRPLLPL